jgi:hypothetical protein
LHNTPEELRVHLPHSRRLKSHTCCKLNGIHNRAWLRLGVWKLRGLKKGVLSVLQVRRTTMDHIYSTSVMLRYEKDRQNNFSTKVATNKLRKSVQKIN